MVLLFDLDNTLVDSSSAYEAGLRAVGTDPADPEFSTARALVKQRLGEGHTSARNRLLYFKAMQEQQAGGDLASPAALLDRMDRYERALEAEVASQWRRLERERLFRQLAAWGPAAIVSDENTRTQLIKLRAFDPRAELFRWIVTSEEVGAEKPTGRPFEVALERLGCAAADCVMIGDSVEADVLPALRLGMRAVLTTEFTRAPSDPPAGVTAIPRLDSLPAVLAR